MRSSCSITVLMGSRTRTVESADKATAKLTVNVADEKTTKDVDGLQIETGITLVKKGAGTQKFSTSTNGTTQLKGGVQVDEGTLEFEGAGSVISGN